MPRQVIVERNKRLMTWMASVLELYGEEKRQFYTDMMLLFMNVTDNELAEIICEKLSPKMLVGNIEDAQKIIRYFYDIAESWLDNTSDDPRA